MITLILALSINSCGVISKNWRKDLIHKETEDYHLTVDHNLSLGCPKSNLQLTTEGTNIKSINITNRFLPDVIRFLVDKTASRTEFENMKLKKALRLDIEYYPKKNQELKAGKDTLLKILEKRIGFTTNPESENNKVYSVTVADPTKLSRHIDKGKTTGLGLPKGRIEIYGSTLSSIFTKLENNLRIFVNYQSEDTTRYKMNIPGDNAGNVVAWFKDECGIELIEKETKVEIIKVAFK